MTRGLASCTSQYLGSKERSCELQLANNDRASLRILARELQAESPHDVADDRSAASYCGIASERRPLSRHQVLLQIEAMLTPSLLGRNAMTGGGLAFARIREMFIRGHRGAWPAGPWAAHLNLHGCMHYVCHAPKHACLEVYMWQRTNQLMYKSTQDCQAMVPSQCRRMAGRYDQKKNKWSSEYPVRVHRKGSKQCD